MTKDEINTIFVQLEAGMTAFIPQWADEAQRRIVNRTPVDTGALKADWKSVIAPGTIEINNTKEYASYVEMGTPHMRPQPMVRTTALEADQISQVAKDKAGLK